MKKTLNNKLNLKRETLSSLNKNEMGVLKGGKTFACPTQSRGTCDCPTNSSGPTFCGCI